MPSPSSCRSRARAGPTSPCSRRPPCAWSEHGELAASASRWWKTTPTAERCELLTRAGFDCHSADRGDAGLTLIREQRPDIAVVDLGLPGINGLEIARRIRSDPSLSHVYRVALTGYGQATDRLTALAAGFDEHVVKPVRAADLLRLLAVDETDAPPFRDGLMPLRRPRDTSA